MAGGEAAHTFKALCANIPEARAAYYRRIELVFFANF
jgi:hypothetical protein